jgi:hypothetical protein
VAPRSCDSREDGCHGCPDCYLRCVLQLSGAALVFGGVSWLFDCVHPRYCSGSWRHCCYLGHTGGLDRACWRLSNSVDRGCRGWSGRRSRRLRWTGSNNFEDLCEHLSLD